eukprot:5477145-Lingulodinium_polyedra.AAC.1
MAADPALAQKASATMLQRFRSNWAHCLAARRPLLCLMDRTFKEAGAAQRHADAVLAASATAAADW